MDRFKKRGTLDSRLSNSTNCPKDGILLESKEVNYFGGWIFEELAYCPKCDYQVHRTPSKEKIEEFYKQREKERILAYSKN